MYTGRSTCRSAILALGLVLLLVVATSAAADHSHGTLAFVEVKYGNIETYQSSAVELSSDGEFLYLGAGGGAITVFSRNPLTGDLLRVQRLANWVGDVIGLFGISDIVISPDGRHLYTSAEHDNAVVVFDRNTTTGQLTFQAMLADGVDAEGLEGAVGLAMSPDGNYVYVAAVDDSTITRFSRDGSTGELTWTGGTIWDGDGLAQDLAGVHGLAISQDGAHLYAVAKDDDAITGFERNLSTGQLTYVGRLRDHVDGVDGLDGARRVIVSPDGNHVYVSAFNDHAVASFSRNSATGWLSYVEVDKEGGTVSDGLEGARDVQISTDGQHVYVSAYFDASVVLFARNAVDGRLTYQQQVKDNTGQADGLEGAQQSAISYDGNHVYVAGRIEGALAVLGRDHDTGALSYLHTVEALSVVNGPVGVAVSPDGQNVYIASNDADTLTVCERNPLTGRIREIEIFVDNLGVDGLDGARAVVVSPDGDHVYVAGYDDDGIAVFGRSPEDGTLAVRDAVLNSDPGVSGLAGIQGLACSPTGAYLYAASSGDDSLVVLSRDPATGDLTFVKRLQDGVGVDGLDDAYSVAVSSDGRHVYVAGYTDDSVSHFEWEKPAGLTYRSTVRDGVPASIDGLDGANSIVISPDGTRLYVASRIDDAIAMFIRGTSSGQLGYHSMIRDNVGGVDGLNGVRAITMNPSGTYIYAASQHEDALAVFGRDMTYGDLTYFTAIRDTDAGIDGLDTANGIAISPVGNHIYVTGYDDDAVSVFVHFWPIYLPLLVRA
jgi:6-phosphogluconolactonase (cycloisomerase 2 family)